MKVGYHAPLPPARTGVAEYAQVLLAKLRERTHVEVGARKADVHLYQLGNNQIHRCIYEMALETPGVVLLHDAALQHFFLGSMTSHQYIEEYVYNYGEWERTLAARMFDQRGISATDTRYYERPMLRRIAERSLAVVVHNPEALERVRRAAPRTPVVEIPHLFHCGCPPQADESARLRHALGIPDHAFVFGLFGYLRESKRVMPVIKTFTEVANRVPQVRLLLAGSFGSQDLARAVEPFLADQRIVRLGPLSERQWWVAADAADAAICLRYPTAGETSGIAVRLMGLGKPVFLTDGPAVSRFPADACFRVLPGVEEQAELSDTMEIAVRLRGVSGAIGKRAAEYVRRFHNPERAADQFLNVLCAVCAHAR